MKTLVFIFVTLFISFAVYGQPDELNCRKFRTGFFTYPMEGYQSVLIKRTRHHQTEINYKEGLTLKFDLNWNNDCEYELILTWSDSEEYRKVMGSTLKANIIETGDDSYDYTASLNGKLTRGTILKISGKEARKMKKHYKSVKQSPGTDPEQ
jgi:hypothetical protein